MKAAPRCPQGKPLRPWACPVVRAKCQDLADELAAAAAATADFLEEREPHAPRSSFLARERKRMERQRFEEAYQRARAGAALARCPDCQGRGEICRHCGLGYPRGGREPGTGGPAVRALGLACCARHRPGERSAGICVRCQGTGSPDLVQGAPRAAAVAR